MHIYSRSVPLFSFSYAWLSSPRSNPFHTDLCVCFRREDKPTRKLNISTVGHFDAIPTRQPSHCELLLTGTTTTRVSFHNRRSVVSSAQWLGDQIERIYCLVSNANSIAILESKAFHETEPVWMKLLRVLNGNSAEVVSTKECKGLLLYLTSIWMCLRKSVSRIKVFARVIEILPSLACEHEIPYLYIITYDNQMCLEGTRTNDHILWRDPKKIEKWKRAFSTNQPLTMLSDPKETNGIVSSLGLSITRVSL